MLDYENTQMRETEKRLHDTRTPKTTNGGILATLTDDAGVPRELAYWAICIGLALSATSLVIILTEKAAQLGALTTRVGFGIILATFGSRAAGGGSM